MKISHLTLRNFRSFNFYEIDFSKYNVFVGQNNSGKSNLIRAIFYFYNPENLTIDDITKNQKGERISNELKICITFDDLTEQEQRENDKYFYNNKLKIELIGKIDFEDNRIKSEHHGYIKSFKFDFSNDFNSNLKELLLLEDTPKVNEIEEIPELDKVRKEVKPKGKLSKLDWDLIRRKFAELNDKIEIVDTEILSLENYQGFAKTKRSERTGKCIFIPAIKDPALELDTSKSKSYIKEFVSNILEGAETEAITKEFKNIQENLKKERSTKKENLEKRFCDELELWDATININLKDFELRQSIPIEFDLLINDGILTDLERKGSGLQRYVFFKFLKIANEMELGKFISYIFLFEEPEAHLHPQIQREIANILREMTKDKSINYQFFVSTHSPQFIDMNNLDEIFVFTKNYKTNFCSEPRKCVLNLTNIKEKINTILYFDPHVCEVFFAKKIVLIEGQSEEIIFNKLIQDGIIDISNVSIINTKSKTKVPLFINVLNELKIPYCVMIDEDPFYLPYFKKVNPEKRKNKRKTYFLTKKIADLIDFSIGKLVVVSPDFDELIGVSKNQADKKGKPVAALLKFKEIEQNNPDKFNEIINLFKMLITQDIIKHNVILQDGSEWKLIDESKISFNEANYSHLKESIRNITKLYENLLLKIDETQLNELLDFLKKK